MAKIMPGPVLQARRALTAIEKPERSEIRPSGHRAPACGYCPYALNVGVADRIGDQQRFPGPELRPAT
jgi:hypothetical protein